MNSRTVRKRRPATPQPAERVQASSGNVYADLRLNDPVGRAAKAELAHHICLLIEEAGLSQSEAAARLGIDQPKVSALMRGRLKDFSTERLMRFITALNRDVVITICDPKRAGHANVRVALEAASRRPPHQRVEKTSGLKV